MTIKTVTIPAIERHEGLYAVDVRLDWVCPVCGGERGQPHDAFSYDGSRRLSVFAWTNDCGHVDKYEDVRVEAKRNGLNTGATMTKTTVIITPDAKMQAQLDAMQTEIDRSRAQLANASQVNERISSDNIMLTLANEDLKAQCDTLQAWKAAVPVDAINRIYICAGPDEDGEAWDTVAKWLERLEVQP